MFFVVSNTTCIYVLNFIFVEMSLNIHSVLLAGTPVRITNKHLIDYIFLRSLEVAVSFDLPVQIHTG